MNPGDPDPRASLLEIDQKIVELAERRLRAVEALVKGRSGAHRYAPTVDAAYLRRVLKSAHGAIPDAGLERVLVAVDGVCRSALVPTRVAVVGKPGDHGFSAARDHFGALAELLPAETTALAIEEVSRARADFALVPYESMKEGLFFGTIEAIAAADVSIVLEREIAHALSLVGRAESLASVERVVAPAHLRAACSLALRATLPAAAAVDVASADAAARAALEDPRAAAIVPTTFELPSELRILRDDVGDEGEVRMRWVGLSRIPAPRSGCDATAMLFSVHDRPGALHDVLQPLKERRCNLRRIQSKPIPGEEWEFLFYVEVDGHQTDRPLVAALEAVRSSAKALKVLGSFPVETRSPASEG